MGFRINTNVAALTAKANSDLNSKSLDQSLSRLSSGLRINSAADDASGMAIADSLRTQASTLGQAISNGNDAISILQTADKAMDEQLKILDTIKTKATQAAQDGQSTKTRNMLQADINRLLEELDNIATTTSFNGKQLLSGSFINQEFQIGAQSNQTVRASIGATQSSKIGVTRFETGAVISESADNVQLSIKNYNGVDEFIFQSVVISTSAGTGLGALAEEINKYADQTGIRASCTVEYTTGKVVGEGTLANFSINGYNFGDLEVQANDKNGALVSAINAAKETTGVEASVDNEGKLTLTSVDGRGIQIKGSNLQALGLSATTTNVEFYGRLTLMKNANNDIIIGGTGKAAAGFGVGKVTQVSVSLKEIMGPISAKVANAMGFFASTNAAGYGQTQSAGVTTLKGAMAVMDVVDTAISDLDKIRADIGSVQNQITSTINNITVTQVNVKSAESTIRDVDFASESANYSKANILAQSGSYALAQANASQQNVLSLLQ